MNTTEIVGKFSLHDVLGYLFPGILVCMGLSLIASSVDSDAKRLLISEFSALHLTGQIAALLSVAYLAGWFSFTVGMVLYNCLSGRWPIDYGFSSGVKQRLEDRTNTKMAIGANNSLGNDEQFFVAYACLLNENKAAFTVTMSARKAMCQALAGAFLFLAMSSFSVGWYEGFACSLFLFGWILCLILGVWFLYVARLFDRWCERHNVFAFLAISSAMSCRSDEA